MKLSAAQQLATPATMLRRAMLRHPATILPVLGTNSLDRIKRISDALKVNLDREAWFRLYEAALGHEVP